MAQLHSFHILYVSLQSSHPLFTATYSQPVDDRLTGSATCVHNSEMYMYIALLLSDRHFVVP